MLTRVQLVAVVGLNAAASPTHAAVLESLAGNRSADRLPLRFIPAAAEHHFPKPKRPRRESYEGYVAGGLLKKSWMRRQVEELPALVVMFLDLDWGDPHWAEKRSEAQSKMASLRQGLEGRNSRLALVLVQTVAPLPAGDDIVGAERAAELCAACDLSPKALFVLPHHTNHLYGYVIRLEQAFYEICQTYYAAEMKRVKAKKDSLSKATHHPLLVRCQFKLGFLSELRQDSHTALRHYKLAYQHLSEVQLPQTHWLEWKTVAGLLSHRIAALCFAHSTPLDAIAQFRRHSEFFKDKVGLPSGLAELHHAAWLARQLLGFAELFEAAVGKGLAALQTQHPGFYFQSAATQAMRQRAAMRGLRASLGAQAYPSPDPLEGLDQVQYYGQFPWRLHLPTGQILAAVEVEEAGAMALKMRESSGDVTHWILDLLSAAMTQFKKYRSPRMRRHILLQVGEEYVAMGDHARGWKLLAQAVWEGRRELWPRLQLRALKMCLPALYALGGVKDYVAVCLELLGPTLGLDAAERDRVQANLGRVLGGAPPEPEPGQTPAIEVWAAQFKDPVFFSLDLSGLKTCVQVRSWVSSCPDGRLRVRVAVLLSGARSALAFSGLSVAYAAFGAAAYAAASTLSDEGGEGRLRLEPAKMKLFEFLLAPVPEDVGKSVTVKSVALSIGVGGGPLCGRLEWSGESMGGRVPTDFAIVAPGLPLFQFAHKAPTVIAEPRTSCVVMDVSHPSVALLGQVLTLKLQLCSKETAQVSNLTVTANCGEVAEGGRLEFVGCPLSFGKLEPGQMLNNELKAHVATVGPITAHIIIRYDLLSSGSGGPARCELQREISLSAMAPLRLETQLRTALLEPATQLVAGAPFCLGLDLSSESPQPLSLRGLQFRLAPPFRLLETPALQQCVLGKGETLSAVAMIESSLPTTEASSPGAVVVSWAPEGSEVVESEIPLPPLSVQQKALIAEGWLGGSGLGAVRAPLAFHFRLRNLQTDILPVQLNLEPSESFMFAGNKEPYEKRARSETPILSA